MAKAFKSHFPIFSSHPELVYLDNAATTHKPASVINAISDFYKNEYSNIQRGIYSLANKTSDKYEKARQTVAEFIGVENPACIAFTSGATEGINIIAKSLIAPALKKGQNVVVTAMEHHANFIPWQELAKDKSAELRVVSLNANGDLDLQDLESKLDSNTAILALTHISNTLGTINPVREIISSAHRKNIPVLLDAAQSAAFYDIHQSVLDYDFLVFSGHKIFGPMGTGVLYVSDEYHKNIRPYNFGGGIITEVRTDQTRYRQFPHILEAGTPNVAGVIGLAEAINLISGLDRNAIISELESITECTLDELSQIDGVNLIGQPSKRSSIISLTLNKIHPHDAASFLNEDQVAVRAGMHCAQPLMSQLGIEGTIRLSFSIYNDMEDVGRFIKSLKGLMELWK